MLRSPFFCFLFFLLFLSCKEENIKPVDSKSIKTEGLNFRKKGIENFDNKNFNSAFYNFNKSKIAFETVNDSANIVFNLIQMAQIQQVNGDYYGSKETLTEALPYIKNKDVYSAAINNFSGLLIKNSPYIVMLFITIRKL